MVNKKKNYNMKFRPKSYFSNLDWKAEVLSGIKGELRRRVVSDFLTSAGITTYEDLVRSMIEGKIDPAAIRDQSPDEKAALGKVHPALMGGEYLPDLEPTSVEIARASLQSVTWDVISVRACLGSDGLIHYSIVDEYDSEFDFAPRSSKLPLTFAEIVRLIDGAVNLSWDETPNSLNRYPRYINIEAYDNPLAAGEALIDFVQISSEFYPQLRAYFEEDTLEWVEEIKGWTPMTRRSIPRSEASQFLLNRSWFRTDVTEAWTAFQLGSRYDFLHDVVETSDAFRLSHVSATGRTLPAGRVIPETYDEFDLEYDVETRLIELISIHTGAPEQKTLRESLEWFYRVRRGSAI